LNLEETGYVWNTQYNYASSGSHNSRFTLLAGSSDEYFAYQGNNNISSTLDKIKGNSASLFATSTTPYIAFVQDVYPYQLSKEVRILYYNGSSWKHISAIPDGGDSLYGTSIVLNAGVLYVSFTEKDTKKLRIMKYSLD